MQPKLIIVEREQTLSTILQELELFEIRDMFIYSINGSQVTELDTVIKSKQELRIFPVISGGSDESFSYIKGKNGVIVGNSYTQNEEDVIAGIARKDKLALKLFEYNFINELEKYNIHGIDIKALLESKNCMKCKDRLHLPEAWKNLSLIARRAYFKVLVQKGTTSGIIYCCNCFYGETHN